MLEEMQQHIPAGEAEIPQGGLQTTGTGANETESAFTRASF